MDLTTIRDGLRWHLIEQSCGSYDWSSWLHMLDAARTAGVEVIWDVFHYGCPDHIDQGSPEFSRQLAAFAAEAVRIHRDVTGRSPAMCPLNEISFFTWACRAGYFPAVGPDEHGWLKRHLIKAAVTAADAMRQVNPQCRFVWAEPLIHVAPRRARRSEVRAAEEERSGQFEAYDWLMGLQEPDLGGRRDLVDVIGLNFYPHNQWYHHGPTIPMGHHEYRPLRDMLKEVAQRYHKPIMLTETGAEGSGRPAWLHYVSDEVLQVMEEGVQVEGICLYPVTAYPGWDNSRHADAGLLSPVTADGGRNVYEPLLRELQRQSSVFAIERSLAARDVSYGLIGRGRA
jgi:beta-glucosidase/6-phospho-beta-glucosidase/beta-galactosidase